VVKLNRKIARGSLGSPAVAVSVRCTYHPLLCFHLSQVQGFSILPRALDMVIDVDYRRSMMERFHATWDS